MVRHGMEWYGIEGWGMCYNLEWDGMGSNGMAWNGMEWDGDFYVMDSYSVLCVVVCYATYARSNVSVSYDIIIYKNKHTISLVFDGFALPSQAPSFC